MTTAFVSEKIITNEDRELLHSFNLKDPLYSKPVEARRWVIDRERGAFLGGMGGQGHYSSEIPHFHALVWKGTVINLETFSMAKRMSNNALEMHWKITSIRGPISLLPESDTILTLIKESFAAESRRLNENNEVIFDHIATPGFLKEVND